MSLLYTIAREWKEVPTVTEGTPARILGRTSLLGRFVASAWEFLRSVKVQRRKRSMTLCETLPLGEKRLLAIVEIDRHRLLIAATNESIALLERLDGSNMSATTTAPFPENRTTEGQL